MECNIANYADDNNLYHKSTNVENLMLNLKNDASNTIEWCIDNQMRPNTDKFQCMVMNRKGSVSTPLFIHDNTIHPSDQVTILGVKLDAKMSFDHHISDLINKASRQLNILRRLSKYLDEKCRINVYTTFISAHFKYCPVAWMFCGRKNFTKLEKLQERALRFVFNDFESSYEYLLQKGNFLSLSSYRLYFLGIEVFKSKMKMNPTYINNLFEERTLSYNLRDSNKFKQSRFNTIKYGFKSFSYYGPKLWNELPIDIKESENLQVFKTRLKKWCYTADSKRLEIC